MNPVQNPSLSRLPVAEIEGINRESLGFSPNVVNVPKQGVFQASGKPPPLPPIPQQMTSQPQMNYLPEMNNPYSRYPNFNRGFGYPLNYGGINSMNYGGISNPFSHFGHFRNGMPSDPNGQNSPFHAIESFVHTIQSLSMLLDSCVSSTYGSLHSFVGVLDNFSRLRQYLFNFLKLILTFDAFKTLLNVCKWILHFFRRNVLKDNKETAWEAAQIASGAGEGTVQHGSAWPMAAFIGIILAGPYILRKFTTCSTVIRDITQQSSEWNPGVDEKQEAVAVYDFVKTSHGFLDIKAGELIYVPKKEILVKCKGWCPAINFKGDYGLVPLNRIRLILRQSVPKTSVIKNANTTPVPKSKPISECASNKTQVNPSCASSTYSVNLTPITKNEKTEEKKATDAAQA